MTGQITIPFLLFLLLLIIFIWAILSRIFLPSVRWFFRRRINRVIDEISSRLAIKIKPFQLTKRQVLIDRLIYDQKVIQAIQEKASEDNIPREVLQAKVLNYAKEIVPSFNAYLYFRFGYWLAKKIARLLYGVRMGMVDNEQLLAVDPEATVVFVMNHRSNMDYILVAFLAAEQTTLSYAVGEWARIWPLQTLIRAMGAYFVRRNSGDPLYRVVLERYIHMATREGVCQAVFLEGGLSRDGLMRPPKFGIVDYMLRDYDSEKDRDVVFVPVGVNYDRTLEDRTLIRSLDPNAPKRSKWFAVRTSVGFAWHNIMLMIFNRWQRFGYACVNFGPIVSTREFCRTKNINPGLLERQVRFSFVEDLCNQLMSSIQNVIPILPISLVATVLLKQSNHWISEFDIKGHVHRLIEDLQAKGSPVYIPGRGWEKALSIAFNMLRIRKMVKENDNLFKADPGSHDILSYYANAIAHWETSDKVSNYKVLGY